MQKICPQCGETLECRQSPGCWCADLPWTVPVPDDRADPAKSCLCPQCLKAVLGRADGWRE